ncbi:MAG: hypothetical protein CMC20_00810 [Flavobacteriaceae bacterium]|nr:hypothetical protein [Flavobacteriaceae bacterium]OUV87246.1 MAG: hypothetical protein CBD05_01000 [Flavobacteriaceae bacterium TMED145]
MYFLFKQYLFFLFLFSTLISSSQLIDNETATDYIRIEGDTIVKGSIGLNEVLLLPRRPFKNSEQIRKYLILKRKTIKVYPYSVMASKRLKSLNDRLIIIKTKRERRRYTRMVQKFLEDELTPELSKLTKSEGQILIKLIYRQTGITTYNLVKNLRNGVKAFLYNTTARFFDLNLKTEFNPEMILDDYYIEDIIQRSVRDNLIEYNEPKNKYDLFKLKTLWDKQN